MGWIIAIIGLLLVFSGSGSFFCFTLLKEAQTGGPWIATAISLTVMCIVIIYIRIKEAWDIKVVLGIMGCFGVVQLIILSSIEMPHYWKDNDECFLRLCSGFFSQPLFILIDCGIARMVEGRFDEKTADICRKIQATLKWQISVLNEINEELATANIEYKRTDKLLKLFTIISESSLETAYINARSVKDKELISKILSENRINMSLQGRTTSAIEKEIEKMIKRKREVLSEISDNKHTRKDYDMLKNTLKLINK